MPDAMIGEPYGGGGNRTGQPSVAVNPTGFVEALTTDVRAALMVALIQQLYQVEHAASDLDPEARRLALFPRSKLRARWRVSV
jgi:hypothetical protein